jgi:hypothetical protein
MIFFWTNSQGTKQTHKLVRMNKMLFHYYDDDHDDVLPCKYPMN